MSQKLIVTADSTCDLTPELCKKYDIHLCPLHVSFPDGDYLDGVNIDSPKVYEIKEATGVLPKTASFNMHEYLEFAKPFFDDGCEVLHVSIGSGLSSCYHNAMMAEEEDGRFHVLHSASLTCGSGMVAVAVAEMVRAGKTIEEIYAKLPEYTSKLDVSFMVDTLEYMHQGGRCSALAMLGASVLNIKISIDSNRQDGALSVGKKYRGPLDKALQAYIRDKLADREDIDTRRIFIPHSPIDSSYIEMVKEEIEKYVHFDEIIPSLAGCVISSHCGPNTVGLAFKTK